MYDRQLTTSLDNVLLFSPGEKSKFFKTPIKQKITKKLYPIHNKAFIMKRQAK